MRNWAPSSIFCTDNNPEKWSSIIILLIYKPRPVPFFDFVLKYGSKILLIISLGIPPALSLIYILTLLSTLTSISIFLLSCIFSTSASLALLTILIVVTLHHKY
jgi:hypothetical protein